MKIVRKRCAFTLVEVLMALTIGGFSLVGMFSMIMSYVNIWRMTSNQEIDESFNRDAILRNFINEQLTQALANAGVFKSSGKHLWFCNEKGEDAAVGQAKCLYWLSHEILPFVAGIKKDTVVKYIKYWLYMDGVHDARTGKDDPGPLYIGYKVITDKSDEKIEGRKKITDKCLGINFGYIKKGGNDSNKVEIEYLNTPKVDELTTLQLPEILQILLDENKEILKHLK